jgi:glycosyltransferase involved in cell wall biosynthesis
MSKRSLLIDLRWVPTPKPEVFQITKRNHNILQGVANPDARFSEEDRTMVESWTSDNASRHWTGDGGPLAPRSAGGADVIVVDDPQMPSLVSLAKKLDPERPVIFRSHIQIRSDLVGRHGTNAAEVWEWIWSHVKHADLFVSHPVASFVPTDVPRTRLAYMPATTDWLDGLNKDLSPADLRYHLADFNELCRREHMPALVYPKRDYIIQIARFDPSKGLEDVLGAYAHFRRYSRYCAHRPVEQTPQLVICGQSSIDDPDGTPIFDKTLACLEERYSDIKDSVIVMRLGPSDQMLNALLSDAHVALQLSLSEGFEIKVSEALHKGVPVIARGVGGIPLQIRHDKSGFIVHASDPQTDIRAVAEYLDILFDNEERYAKMSDFACKSVSDEVSTLGNAICWMYVVNQLLKKPGFCYNGRWIWELAREEAQEPIGKFEARLQHVS